ncbi:histidine kinase N-terminal 7TM domain-containing protein [Faecalicatena contorta]|uniref:histidine kinase N-terminal 7TM domain-containing protein n=1 Tax=Faecalicatena contorta TaxID=39482 RepID=UPI001F3FBAE8|nr:histidine kinase N-terminal 7TM domain-containing protein [Faecalicatena contorta]MCF2554578.1 hypothetical protein [Faecalicatena contorta]MCF2679510.1 hypothetical protein [Faecalicatena contorta]
MQTFNMSVVYGIIVAISFLLAIGYSIFARKKEVWLVWLFVSVFIVNLGYFTLSISKDLEGALLANRLAYLGSVFLPFFMLMTIMDICKMKYKKIVPVILLYISSVMFLIAASPGYYTGYYREVSLVFVNDMAKLVKTYGPLHSLYFVYLFLYFGMMAGVILFSMNRKNSVSHKHAFFLAVVAFMNLVIWFVEQLIYWDFEFLSVSYIISELLLLLLYGMLQDYEQLQDCVEGHQGTATVPEYSEEEIAAVFPQISTLTVREKEVFQKILKNKKRKDIAEELCVTESTVKKHTSHIFAKLGVSSREGLFAKLNQK